MFTILSDHIILTGLILLFLLFSIICQIISAVIYQNMINQADNMSSTENKYQTESKRNKTLRKIFLHQTTHVGLGKEGRRVPRAPQALNARPWLVGPTGVL